MSGQIQWRAAACLLAWAIAQAPAAIAHAVVKQSVPSEGAVLAVAPAEVIITFNEKIDKVFSGASLHDAAGATVSSGKALVDPANAAVLKLAVPTLKAGKYTVQWHAVGHDGHRLAGQLHFSVK